MTQPVQTESALERLEQTRTLSDAELTELLSSDDAKLQEALFRRARAVARANYGNRILIRGLIEISSYCRNDCFYCGIRRSNTRAERYRLTPEQILSCCRLGYDLGFRTFVLQGGEDPHWTDERLAQLVAAIHRAHPDCAITLSVGERSAISYQKLFDAGADRYLLRHETADDAHYALLHPAALSPTERRRCLYDLKKIGYQVGCGMMIGSPGQTLAHLVKDLRFMQALQPEMVGIGPFLPHHQTPFAREPAGSLRQTLRLLAIVRLILPQVLLPATTALSTASEEGRTQGVLAGANVIMPNLSPPDVRRKYLLYDNKRFSGAEAAEAVADLHKSMQAIGYQVVVERGDAPDFCRKDRRPC
jgi:biotin synthase